MCQGPPLTGARVTTPNVRGMRCGQPGLHPWRMPPTLPLAPDALCSRRRTVSRDICHMPDGFGRVIDDDVFKMSNVKDWHDHARVLRALTHPTRLGIVAILSEHDACVCHLGAVLGQRQAAISQHLMVLRAAGLVDDHRVGIHVYYRNCDPRLPALLEALAGPSRSAGVASPHPACSCPRCRATRASTDGLEAPDSIRHTASIRIV